MTNLEKLANTYADDGNNDSIGDAYKAGFLDALELVNALKMEHEFATAGEAVEKWADRGVIGEKS